MIEIDERVFTGESYGILCDDILKINTKIRYAGVFDFTHSVGKMQKGVTSNFTPKETQQSGRQAFVRWDSRRMHAGKTGEPICAVGKYENLYRITLPLNKFNLILVSTELDIEPFEIVEKISELKQKYILNHTQSSFNINFSTKNLKFKSI
jgi:hypothetical protein